MKDYAKPSLHPPKEQVVPRRKIKWPSFFKNPWCLMGCGLTLGLLIAFGVYFKLSRDLRINGTIASVQTTKDNKESHKEGNRRDTRKWVREVEELSKPQFEFYDILPAREVTIDPPKPVVQSVNKQFMVQVASYQDKFQAQKVIQKLKQAQIEAHITLTPSGWWRVDVGPFENRREADGARVSIQAQGMIGSLIREIPKP